MDGSIRALAMGAAFSLVAAGFAYAVPRAILTTAEQVIVEEAPIEVTEPIVDDTQEVEIEPIGETGGKSGGKSGGKGGRKDGEAKDNHGAAVSTAARCNLRSRAQGELSSSTARNKDATVESAQDACDEASSEPQPDPATGGKSESHAPETAKGKGQPKNQSTSGSTTDGDSGSGDSGSGDSGAGTAPGKSGSTPPKASKDRGGPKNQSIPGAAIADDSDDSGDETSTEEATDDDPGAAASKARGNGSQS